MRGAFGGAPDVAEFDYYTVGYYDYGGVIYPARGQHGPVVYSGNRQLRLRAGLCERV